MRRNMRTPCRLEGVMQELGLITVTRLQQMREAGIDPNKPVTSSVKQRHDNSHHADLCRQLGALLPTSFRGSMAIVDGNTRAWGLGWRGNGA